jgi:hypothetical protein
VDIRALCPWGHGEIRVELDGSPEKGQLGRIIVSAQAEIVSL